jgi:murein tripeptide amidase MpaA
MSWFNSYHDYADHIQWVSDLQALNPEHAEVVVSGKSLSGRPITGVHLFKSAAAKGSKPGIVFHGTVHAREWISTMVSEYLAHQLLTGLAGGGDADAASFFDKYEFYIFPLVNPDGFVYTQTTDRLWRKNRQVTSGSSCVGRDINRNWPFAWDTVGGSSREPCAQDYRGVKQGDAPETESLMAHLREVRDRQGLKLFIDFHSYAQVFMSPYGYDCERKPKNGKELLKLGKGTVEAIEAVHGSKFASGPICNLLYQSSGTSVDYVQDVIKADYSYTLELRDQGKTGFVLPPEQILPAGEETWAGIKWLVAHLK